MSSWPNNLDPRVNAYRPDLADKALVGQLTAKHFVEGQLARVAHPRLPMFGTPDLSGPMISELRLGEFVDQFEKKKGVAWVQNRSDRYVGYVAAAGLVNTIADPAWRVTQKLTYLYPEPDFKTAPLDMLPYPARVAVLDRLASGWARLATGGYVYALNLESAEERHSDYVFTAGSLLGAPYLWGGRTSFGIDCSGLVQLALELAGQDCPRDSDMQRAAFGVLAPSDWHNYPYERGDLVFFKDHVGIMADISHVVNANAHHMCVVSEPLEAAAARYPGGVLAIGARDHVIR